MNNEKLLKRIEQTESELAKLKSELNKPELPSWNELGISSMGFTFYDDKMNYKPIRSKCKTLAKLLAVADYVNEGWTPRYGHGEGFETISIVNGTLIKCSNSGYIKYMNGQIPFKPKGGAQKAIDIFKHNDSEQELIDFFK